MSVDTFSGLTNELDRWFIKEAQIQGIKARADVLIKQRFDEQTDLSLQALNEEAKFYRLLSKKISNQTNCKGNSLTTISQIDARSEKIKEYTTQSNALLQRYVYESDVAALTDARALRERVTVVQEDAKESSSVAMSLLYGLGEKMISSPNQYITHRRAIQEIYRQSTEQLNQAQELLTKLEIGHFDREAKKWDFTQKHAPSIFERPFMQAYEFVMHPTQWISTASNYPRTSMAIGCAVTAGGYLFPFAASSLIGGSVLVGGIFSALHTKSDGIEEQN